MRQLFLVGFATTMMISCGLATDDEQQEPDDLVKQLIQNLYQENGLTAWPVDGNGIANIRVCFSTEAKTRCDGRTGDTCNFALRKQILRTALVSTWDLYTDINFWDFDLCTAGGGSNNPNDALIVKPIDDPPGGIACQAGLGSPNGYHSHGSNSLFFLTFGGDVCDDATSALGRWTGVVSHEVGHALGFQHEHIRAENFSGGLAVRCVDGATYYGGATAKTSGYDPWSMMGYCSHNLTDWAGAPNWYGSGPFLSFGDITGARVQYGTSSLSYGLVAIPALDLLL